MDQLEAINDRLAEIVQRLSEVEQRLSALEMRGAVYGPVKAERYSPEVVFGPEMRAAIDRAKALVKSRKASQ